MGDLVERLRWASKMYRSHQEYEMTITREAADHIEALEAEVERFREDPRLTLTLEHLTDALGAMRYNNCAPPGRYSETETAFNAVCWELDRADPEREGRLE